MGNSIYLDALLLLIPKRFCLILFGILIGRTKQMGSFRLFRIVILGCSIRKEILAARGSADLH